MNGRDDRAAWAGFWSQSRTAGGCLANAPPEMTAVFAAVWRDAAQRLPKGGRVLDLATGDGTVLARIGQSRGDLKLTGIDSSPVLPAAPAGVRLRSAVSMEQLPYPDASFDLVTSQFGFEYGDRERVAGEAARVLRPGSALVLVLHRQGSPVVRYSEARHAALVWAARDSGLTEKAKGFAFARQLARLPVPPLFRAAPAEAALRFPGQAVARDYAAAILQTLELGHERPAVLTADALAALRSAGEHELARLEALSRAALGQDALSEVAGQLRAAGLGEVSHRALTLGEAGEAFAWLLRTAKPRT